MKLLYYPGCSIRRDALEYEEQALKLLGILNVEVHELSSWYCCGALYSLARDDLMKHIGGLRTLIRAQLDAEKYGTDKLLTICPMCYNVLKRVNNMLKQNPENLETLSLFMDDEKRYMLGLKVTHLLEILKLKIGELRELSTPKKPDLVVAPYYGCTLLRPREIAIDNAENPDIMDEILVALNVEVVNFPLKTECCGSYHSVFNRKVGIEKSSEIIEEAVSRGANTIAVICPLCKYNLDLALKSMEKRHVKVTYLTDIILKVVGT